MITIRINTDQLYEILTDKWVADEEIKVWNHIEKNGFIFNEYRLTIKGSYFGKYVDMVYKVKLEGYEEEQKIYVREVVIEKSGKREIHEHVTTVNEFLEGLEKSIAYQLNVKEKENKIFESDRVLAPMYFMRYSIKKAMNQEVIEIEKTKRKYKPMKERSKSKPKTEYKLFEIIRKYEKHMNKNRHNITCEHWEVKGHFRHYKSGKVVYVKPFSKGKNKDSKTENRIYRL